MSPFQPKGSRALRVIVADMAAEAELGELLTFRQLGAAIGVGDDENGRGQVRQSVSAARPLLLGDHGRALVAVRGKGYRVALPGELAGIAQEHRRRSERSIGRALAVIEHGDTTTMTTEERRRFQAVGMAVRNLHSRMTSAEERLADLEETVQLLLSPKPKVVQGEVEKETGNG